MAEGSTRPRSPRGLAPRRRPLQQRSLARAEQIIDVAAAALQEVGFDDLTTILIAREAGISVGTLYHYYPNKHAILNAMGERWLTAVDAALEKVHGAAVESLSIDEFVDLLIDGLLAVYRRQQGILPLVQAMFAVPELRELDERHDRLVIARLVALWKRRGVDASPREADRLARACLELTHALLLVVVNQSPRRSARTLADLKRLTCCLLEP